MHTDGDNRISIWRYLGCATIIALLIGGMICFAGCQPVAKQQAFAEPPRSAWVITHVAEPPEQPALPTKPKTIACECVNCDCDPCQCQPKQKNAVPVPDAQSKAASPPWPKTEWKPPEAPAVKPLTNEQKQGLRQGAVIYQEPVYQPRGLFRRFRGG